MNNRKKGIIGGTVALALTVIGSVYVWLKKR